MWYPETVNVGPEGTASTYKFMKTAFTLGQHFSYAEFGIYLADTAKNVCSIFPNSRIYLFDFEKTIEIARDKLIEYNSRINYYANTQRYNDSYNWSLIKLIKENNGVPIFDYCFLDGAHTFAIDGLTFFLCDKLLRVGGYIDFDDYNWKLRGSSLDPSKIPAIAEQYTDEQINECQVKLIVDELVRRDARYQEVVKDKIFKKMAP